MSKRPPKPAAYPWLMPYLTVKDAGKALDFYQRAFGFEKRMAMPGPDGKPMHCEMTHHDAVFMFGPENPANECKAPVTTGAVPAVVLYVYCDDVDALHARATAAGAKSSFAPQNMFYGDRVCKLTDPDGHSWNFATNFADFDPSQAPPPK